MMIYEEALYQVYVPLPIDWWVFPGVMFRGFMSLSPECGRCGFRSVSGDVSGGNLSPVRGQPVERDGRMSVARENAGKVGVAVM